MPFDKKYDKIALKAAWEDWAQGKRPDCPTIPELAIACKVPTAYLYKHSGKWGRELRQKLQGQLDTVVKGRPRRRGQDQGERIVRGKREGLNADKTLPLSPLYTDEYRSARKLGKDAMSIAMQGLIEEATKGTGASRVSAIRELLDRAGLAKDKERKDEPSPYEEEDAKTLRERMTVLLGSNKIIASLLGLVEGGDVAQKEPHHLAEATSANPLTPSPSLAQVLVEVPGRVGGDSLSPTDRTNMAGLPGDDVPIEDRVVARVMLR